MKKQPKPPPDTKPQRKRFIEAARKIEVDETGEEFERAFRKIVPQKKVQNLNKI